MSDETATDRARRGRARAAPALALAFALATPAVRAQSQAWLPEPGHGSASVAVQQLYISTHTLSDGSHGFPGSIHTRSVFLELDYGLSSRFAINLSLPYKSSRFNGPGVHNPGTLDDDHGEGFQDDGDYHGGWQDARVALRYRWIDGPVQVTPFIAYGSPVRDYNTFAHSAVGTGQTHLQLGVAAAHRFAPPLQNLYASGVLSYSVMEKVEDRRVNHGTLTLELGYFLTPRFSASVIATGQKTWNGFDFPQDYPNQHDDHYYHHDQNLRNDFINVGVAMTFQATPADAVFLTCGHTAWGENTHLIDYALTLGVSHAF